MAIDLVSEYLFGFGVGLFVLQALFMRDMFGGSYAKAVQRSFLPEGLSMNMVMAGMVPVMVALMSHATGAMGPSSIRFWGVMSLAIMVGGVIAYPVNVWLVAAGLKHGMGSVRVLGAGGHSLEAEATRMRATSGEVPMRMAPKGAKSAKKSAAQEDHAKMSMIGGTTTPQLVAVAVLTLIALGGGIVLADLSGGLGMGSTHMTAVPASH
jgi:hypothetical protein